MSYAAHLLDRTAPERGARAPDGEANRSPSKENLVIAVCKYNHKFIVVFSRDKFVCDLAGGAYCVLCIGQKNLNANF